MFIALTEFLIIVPTLLLYSSHTLLPLRPQLYTAHSSVMMPTHLSGSSETLVRHCLEFIRSPQCGQAATNYVVANPFAVDDGLLPDVYSDDNLDAHRLLQELADIMINTNDSQNTERDVEGAYLLLPPRTS